MDYLDIVFMIFGLIYFVFHIMKKMAAAEAEQKSEGEAGKPKSGSMIENILEKIREEAELAKQGGVPAGDYEDDSASKRLEEDDRYEIDEWEEDGASVQDEVEEEYEREEEEWKTRSVTDVVRKSVVIEPEALKETISIEVPKIDDRETVKLKEEKPPVVIEKAASSKPGVSTARLREAIIWSEILAPPVGLRDDD